MGDALGPPLGHAKPWMAAAPRAFVQRTALDATIDNSQANRAAIARAKLTLNHPEVQPIGAQHPSAETGPAGSVAELQPAGP